MLGFFFLRLDDAVSSIHTNDERRVREDVNKYHLTEVYQRYYYYYH